MNAADRRPPRTLAEPIEPGQGDILFQERALDGIRLNIRNARATSLRAEVEMTEASYPATNGFRDDVRAIRALTEACRAAVQGKDLERLLNMITDDAIFLSAALGPIHGKDAVAALYRDSFAKYDIEQASRLEEVEVLGDWACAWGTDALTLTPLDGGAPIVRRGYGLSILQRQADGSWRFWRGINNMVEVSPGAKPQA
jgi:uncharacterized protein (TIGR02246 family)